MLSPLYGQLSPLRVPTAFAAVRQVSDADALAYIAAVETADGQSLEAAVQYAYEDFILGCKSDGIWSAIKSSCILAGARTLSGALVPLVGSAPTNNNFVSGDYDRETGLKGNGSTKYLNSNRSADSDPQNDVHISANVTNVSSGVTVLIGSNKTTYPATYTHLATAPPAFYPRLNNATPNGDFGGGNSVGLFGASRSSATSYHAKSGSGSIATINFLSRAHGALNHFVFGLNNGGTPFQYTAARLSYYSIGESLDLAALDTRVSTLMTDLAAAI